MRCKKAKKYTVARNPAAVTLRSACFLREVFRFIFHCKQAVPAQAAFAAAGDSGALG
jgi:hypothetical protein